MSEHMTFDVSSLLDTMPRAVALPADGLSELQATPAGAFWLAADPATGRKTLWHWAKGESRAVTPPLYDVGSRVNGYGGGAYACFDEFVVIIDNPSQQLLQQPLAGGEARPWWSRPDARYGGMIADPHRCRVLAVEEYGDGRQGSQRLVAIREGELEVIAEGSDFYGAPSLSPDGRWLAWVEWQLPNMPWQRSTLKIAELGDDGLARAINCWDGGTAVSQPRFASDGGLIVMSDHGGWWQPYRFKGETVQLLCDWPADHIPTPWQLGENHHLWQRDGGIVVRLEEGAAHVLHLDSQGHSSARYFPDASRVAGLASAEGWLYAITQGVGHTARLERVRFGHNEHQQLFCLATPDISLVPETLTITVGGDEWFTAFLYHGDGKEAQAGTPMPLIIRVHGGPTSASYPVYDPLVHWWMQQGFAVADINPRGSGNWGRAFRERLAGEWGQLDVEDVIALADELVAQGVADVEQLFIRGQSAGGFTVLNTLAATTCFRAGASLYGVTDAPRLAAQTHRFESGYLEWLLGDTASQRSQSPRYRVDAINSPVIFFQGDQDPVVVPEQTHAMAAALQRRDVKARVVLFDDEGHGIRHPDNRRRMFAEELAFFASTSRTGR